MHRRLKLDGPCHDRMKLNNGEWTDCPEQAWYIIKRRNQGAIMLCEDHLRREIGLRELELWAQLERARIRREDGVEPLPNPYTKQ